MKAVIQTTKGALEIELFDDRTPITVTHFCNLVDANFYDNLSFFKHIANILIQTGCPNNDGSGDTGFWIKCELSATIKHHKGSLSMAHAGKNTNSSQFFICLNDKEARTFNKSNTCFGQVLPESFDTLKQLQKGDKIENITINYFEGEEAGIIN